MSNAQLYLVIGIPSVLALVGIATNITLYVFMAGRLDRRLERFEDKFDDRFKGLEKKVEAIETRLHDDMQSILGRDREMDRRVMRLEEGKAN